MTPEQIIQLDRNVHEILEGKCAHWKNGKSTWELYFDDPTSGSWWQCELCGASEDAEQGQPIKINTIPAYHLDAAYCFGVMIRYLNSLGKLKNGKWLGFCLDVTYSTGEPDRSDESPEIAVLKAALKKKGK